MTTAHIYEIVRNGDSYYVDFMFSSHLGFSPDLQRTFYSASEMWNYFGNNWILA